MRFDFNQFSKLVIICCIRKQKAKEKLTDRVTFEAKIYNVLLESTKFTQCFLFRFISRNSEIK